MSYDDTHFYTMEAWNVTVMDTSSGEKHERIFLNYLVSDVLEDAVEWYRRDRKISVMPIQAVYMGEATYGVIER